MFARTASGRARSMSNGPPGASRMMKNATVTMTRRTGGKPASLRARYRATARSFLDGDVLERVLVEDVRVPALHLLIEHALVDVGVEGHDRHVVGDEELLGLVEELHPLRRVERPAGPGDQLVVALVRPAGLVVAATGDPHVEERVGIDVVADPASARQLEIEGRLPGEIDLPLDVDEVDLDPERLLPHLLDGLGNGALEIARVVNELDLREPLAVREARVGERLLCRRHVVRQPSHAL